MDEKRNEQAMKLYEAMSGVDPELLARSEKAEKKNKVIPFWRYAKVMAACLALFVVGSACWAVMHNGLAPQSKQSTADGTSKSTGKSENYTANAITQDAGTMPAEQAENAIGAHETASFSDECDAVGMEAEESEKADYGANSESQQERQEEATGIPTGTDGNATSYRGILAFNLQGLDVSGLLENAKRMKVGVVLDKEQLKSSSTREITNDLMTYKTVAYLEGLEKIQVDYCELEEDFLSITVYGMAEDGDTSEAKPTEVYNLDRKHMILSVAGEYYEIVDPEYDYERLSEELLQITQGEE